MDTSLFDTVRRYADAHADQDGIARTPIRGLCAIRSTVRTEVNYEISRPLVCLVLQGEKHVAIGSKSLNFQRGDSLLITADVPTMSQITQASQAFPYYSLVVELDTAIIARLATEMRATPEAEHAPLSIGGTDNEVEEAALRLMHLLQRPASIPLLHEARMREFHYWLLSGRHAASILRLGLPDSHARRVGRAVSLLREQFAQRLPVERLAAVAGMSPSSFHEHFRSVTSLTPLQFQKQLRLIEARRLMLAEGASASRAAFNVGYESVHQFTREYGRMFGRPPMKDVAAAMH